MFAIGDVAKTGGPRMARAAREQGDVVTSNILSMINGQKPSTLYRHQIYEGVIKLTLGKVRQALDLDLIRGHASRLTYLCDF